MGIFKGLFAKRRPEAPASPLEEFVDIARRTVPTATELSYYFICSGNASLIEAYHDVFRIGAPAYGGSASRLSATTNQLYARIADSDAESLTFAGRRFRGSDVEDVENVAAALRGMIASGRYRLELCSVAVGPSGRDWVHTVYADYLHEAVAQGLLPVNMYMTESKETAEFLLDSFTRLSG